MNVLKDVKAQEDILIHINKYMEHPWTIEGKTYLLAQRKTDFEVDKN